jgi:hypothetical protein
MGVVVFGQLGRREGFIRRREFIGLIGVATMLPRLSGVPSLNWSKP